MRLRRARPSGPTHRVRCLDRDLLDTVEKVSKKTCSAVLQLVEESRIEVLLVWSLAVTIKACCAPSSSPRPAF